jgi:hypothetical protein
VTSVFEARTPIPPRLAAPGLESDGSWRHPGDRAKKKFWPLAAGQPGHLGCGSGFPDIIHVVVDVRRDTLVAPTLRDPRIFYPVARVPKLI